MGKERLTAFSDGVVAIIITIMVLELKVPHGIGLADLAPVLPVFLAYVLSFIYVGIYWNNHHHLLTLASSVSGPILWANMHLLFWLSMVPFATAWMGENQLSAVPVALYGGVLIMNAVAFTILMTLLVRHEGPRLRPGAGHGPRLQGQGLAGDLRRRRRAGLRPADGVDGALCDGGGDLVHARPAGGAGAGGVPLDGTPATVRPDQAATLKLTHLFAQIAPKMRADGRHTVPSGPASHSFAATRLSPREAPPWP